MSTLVTYAKALKGALPVVGASGDELPQGLVVEGGATVQRERLTAYAHVCGFRLRDEAPSTYVHVLGFPLQMDLMTRGEFPFAVLGLVHLENRIEQRRAVRVGEEIAYQVHAERLRPHARGQMFDLVMHATVDGEDVWRGTSTYLRKGGGGASGEAKGAKERQAAPDTSGEGDATWTVPEHIGRSYGGVSGDRNPIHLHQATARLFGMPRPIAHGMWLKARCLAALEGVVPEAHEVAVRFKLPVPLPSKVLFSSQPDGDGRAFAVRAARDGKPHLDGRVGPA
ncbi:MaoC/PaaZ C-terminal domain-containing protein [Conexibacter sp. SYSU D00693]|uniref:MaoC/PaaZ C-terminal domain-containing protein n=1 Tax=Conexibacter sp. SYSU D00693 TaxID=2812560 RepID=UPI00196B813A|nr:MaoC/PaaZ C-terminal domain-containing protein [Conexibacter sp. SYSU D00693]